jgi:hypothetical protein
MKSQFHKERNKTGASSSKQLVLHWKLFMPVLLTFCNSYEGGLECLESIKVMGRSF